MYRVPKPSVLSSRVALRKPTSIRTAATQAQKRAGDISDAFASLAGQAFEPLAPEYADLKGRLIKGHEEALVDSWNRLLKQLQTDVPIIKAFGSNVIPEIDFKDLDSPSKDFDKRYRETGVAVVRQAMLEQEVLDMKEELREYIRKNPQTKAFPADNPQVFELYWSRAQLIARAHPNMLKTFRFLMSPWHTVDPSALVSTSHSLAYADRLRMRLPGDAKFALGPHVDGGSVERWDERGYGLGGVYDAVWRGEWESFDPWESSSRMPVVSDLHQGIGACSMFRMSQGWLSMSNAAGFEGTLLVNPLLNRATAYYLLRPFFSAKKQLKEWTGDENSIARVGEHDEYLAPENWQLDASPTSWLQGATPGRGQELSPILHPHLDLESTMVHVPRVRPGDYVAWHCDTIHAVDKLHAGKTDSSVLYIPACPLTEANAQYLTRQRDCFVRGVPSPDFGGGEGESNHDGRITAQEYENMVDADGARAMGLREWDSGEEGLTKGQKEVLDRANKTLGFYE